MKKLLIVAIAACALTCAGLTLTACAADVHNHDFVESIVPQTCTQDGYHFFECECGVSYREDELPAYGHSFENYVSDGNATCTEDGTKTAKCEYCDETDTIAEAAHHVFEQGACTVCGATEGLAYTYNKTTDTYAVTGMGTATVTDVVIPAVYEGKPVTELKELNDQITSVTILEGVRTIGASAFSGCKALTSVTLPDSLEVISGNAFINCSALEQITIPYGVKVMGTNAFYGCWALKTVYWNATECITENVRTYYVFQNCYELSSIIFGENVVSLPEKLCVSLEKLSEVYIPASLTTDFVHAFSRTYLSSVTVAEDNEAFSSQDGILYNKDKTEILLVPIRIAGSVTIPGTITAIKASEFQACSFITELILEEGLQSIGNYAFQNCSAIPEVVIPDSVTTLGEQVFDGCKALKKLVIGRGVKTIGELIAGRYPSTDVQGNLRIYCRATSASSGWVERWNTYITGSGVVSKFSVVWGYTA